MKHSRFVVFALVGVAGFLVDAGILQALSQLAGVEVHVARVVSFLVASATTWRLNRRYTFGSNRVDGPVLIEWLRYLWSSAAGGLVNYGAFATFITLTGRHGIYPVLGVAVGSVAGMCVNYGLYSRYVFRRPGRTADSALTRP
jgi:putative flippase GtrA